MRNAPVAGTVGFAVASASAAAAGVELEEEILELSRVEGERELAGRTLVRGAARHPRAETSAVRRFEQEVEVLVGPGGHIRPFRTVPFTPCWSREVA